MRAGLLSRNLITIKRYENNQTDSGQIVKELVEVGQVRAYILKQGGRETETAEGKELFDSQQLIFQIRYTPLLRDSDVVLLNGTMYKVVNIFNNVWDRTLKVTADKINQ